MTPLQTRLAREIITLVRRGDMRAGDRIVGSLLAEKLGISRTPVNSTLKHLRDRGVLRHDPNRGYVLAHAAADCLPLVEDLFSAPDEPLYLRIAEDRQRGALADEASEAELMRRYNVARSTLRTVLARIQQEGWAERQLGNGWKFLPLIDSPEAYEESYRFREITEPAGILSASFRVRADELGRLRERQTFIAETGYLTMTSIELFEANAEFHETLANWSGNRFIVQAIRRIDALRRLIEYGQAMDRLPRRRAAVEHLAILDALARQDLLSAANLLRDHLNNARQGKVYNEKIFPKPTPS